MRLIIVCLLIVFLNFDAQAKKYDVDCLPAKAWDTGYEVRMLKTLDGSYSAALDQLAWAGRMARYRGKAKLEVISNETNCVVAVTTVTDNGLPFEVHITGAEEAHMISVSNNPVDEHVREMKCELSERFLADLQAICNPVIF